MATGRVPTTANSPLTAKGDLFGYSTTQARVAVGSDGDTLVADSAATTGLRWQGLQTAGKNIVINGAMDFWQRGTSITTAGAYTADRWGQVSGVSATFSRSTDVPSNSGFTYSMSMAGVGPNINQRIESIQAAQVAGQTVTVSFWYKSTVGTDVLNFQLWYANSADNFAGLTQIGSTQTINTPSTSWTRVSYTFTNISANAINGLSLYIYRGNNATSTTLVTGVQLELGSVATSFSRAAGTLAGELAACQRYYYRMTADSAYAYMMFGLATGTTSAKVSIPAPVTMRVVPTSLDTPTASTLRMVDGVSGYALNGTPTLDLDCTNEVLTINTSVASGLTQYRPYWAGANNSSSAYFGFSAEL